MTDVAADTRPIDAEAPQYNARLVRREDMTESLGYFWVRFDGEPYRALIGSAYAKREGGWKLAFHQHSPM